VPVPVLGIPTHRGEEKLGGWISAGGWLVLMGLLISRLAPFSPMLVVLGALLLGACVVLPVVLVLMLLESDRFPRGILWSWSLVGNTREFVHDMDGFLTTMRKRFGPIFTVCVFGGRVVMLQGLSAQRFLFNRDLNSIDKQLPYSWKQLLIAFPRKSDYLFEKSLKCKFAEALYRLDFNAELIIGVFTRTLTSCDATSSVDLLAFTRKLFLKLDTQTLFGIELDENVIQDLFQEQLNWSQGFSAHLPFNLPGSRLNRSMKSKQRILEILQNIQKLRLNQLIEIGTKQTCLLDHLLKHKDIVSSDEVLTCMFQCVSSTFLKTAPLAASLLKMLHRFPGHLEKLDELFERTSVNDLISSKQFSYLDAFIAESIRFMHPSPLVFRKLNQDESLSLSSIPSSGLLCLYLLSEPSSFTSPMAFEPNRFLPPHSEHRGSPYQFIPFGKSEFKCIAEPLVWLELKCFMLALVQGFSFQVSQVGPDLTYPCVAPQIQVQFITKKKFPNKPSP
jgi:cytochrome P450